MAKAGADPEKPQLIDEDAEVLIGQMMFAIGQGADGVHIHRTAVMKMRERYRPTTYKFIKDKPCTGEEPDDECWETIWQKNAVYTLRYFEAIGRLAAQYATNDGTPAIDGRHFEQARVVVEATYYAERPKDDGKVHILGDICPPGVAV